MRTNHAFRPQLTEILEARAVPSMAGVTVATGIHGISVTLPKQVSLTNPQVQAAFKAFDQSYIQAVDTLLSTAGPNGLVVSSTSLATFDSTIEQSLQALAKQLVLSLNAGSTGSTTSPAASQIVSAIVGGSNSLESQLLGLSLAQLQASVPGALGASGGSSTGLVPNAVTTAEQVRVPVRVPEAEEVGTSPSTDTALSPTTTSPSTQAADDVRSAFNSFLGDYFKAVQGTLLAPGSTGQVNTQANRAAFNAKVDQALQSLQTTLAASLGRYPATSALGPQIKSAIEGAGASSLKGQLANLATPEGAQATVVRNFTLGSTRAIAQALASIGADVAKVMAPAGP
jgi:hypothetical protein